MLRMLSSLESRSDLLHLWTYLERKRIQPTFSPMATGCSLLPEQRHQEGTTSWCSARQNSGTERAFRGPQCAEEMSQKRNLMEFTIASNEIQHIVIRNSKFAGLRRSASRWTTGKPLLLPIFWVVREIQEKLIHHTEQIRQKCTDETQIRLPRSTDKYAPSSPWVWRSDLNQIFSFNAKGGIRRLLYPLLHGGSGMNTGGAHIFLNCCGKIVCRWRQSAATDGGCEQKNTFTCHILSCFTALISMLYVTLAEDGCPHHVFYASCALSSSFFILLIFIFTFHVGRFGGACPVRFREWGVRHFGRQHSSHSTRSVLHCRHRISGRRKGT